jgi:NADPH-dependent curcumin reductase CurA
MNQVAHFVKKRALPLETDFCGSKEKCKYLSDNLEIASSINCLTID